MPRSAAIPPSAVLLVYRYINQQSRSTGCDPWRWSGFLVDPLTGWDDEPHHTTQALHVTPGSASIVVNMVSWPPPGPRNTLLELPKNPTAASPTSTHQWPGSRAALPSVEKIANAARPGRTTEGLPPTSSTIVQLPSFFSWVFPLLESSRRDRTPQGPVLQ